MRIIIFCLILLFGSCIVKGPKYTRVEKVMNLKLGMTLNEVNNILGLRPYNLRSIDSVGVKEYVYKYRLTDRRTVPLFLKDTNGQEVRAKFQNLHCKFNANDSLISLYTGATDSELKEQRLNINTVLTFITITAPAFLVYLGITQN